MAGIRWEGGAEGSSLISRKDAGSANALVLLKHQNLPFTLREPALSSQQVAAC